MSGRRPGWLMQLPNMITATRLLALPVILLLALTAKGPLSEPPGWVFAGVAVTDAVDGALARRLGAQSTFGRIADPLCDRLLVVVGAICLVALGSLPAWGPLVIIARDAVAVAGFAILQRLGHQPRVDVPGKISSGLVMLAVPIAMGFANVWVDILFWTAVVGSVASLVNYLARIPRRRPLRVAGDRGPVG